MAIPEGAIRYNTDSNKMEVWIGDKWMIVSTSESSTIAPRAVNITGYGPADTNTIDYFNIPTQGNAIDFGDDTISRRQAGGCSSRTRGINAAGTPDVDTISFIEIATAGNAQDFGNLSDSVNGGRAGCSEWPRGLICGGDSPLRDTIDFITFS